MNLGHGISPASARYEALFEVDQVIVALTQNPAHMTAGVLRGLQLARDQVRALAITNPPPHNADMPPMTPDQLRACIAALGWSQRQLARILGCDEGRVRKWARGGVEIPPAIGPWLRALAAVHIALPLPDGWNAAEPGQ